MKKVKDIKIVMLVILMLVILVVAGCGGTIPPVENPSIEVTSPKDGDVIDWEDRCLEISWISDDVQFVDIDFGYGSYNSVSGDDFSHPKGQWFPDVFTWEPIAVSILSDGHFVFRPDPDIGSWILDVFKGVPDMCQIRMMGENELLFAYSGIFTVTFE